MTSNAGRQSGTAHSGKSKPKTRLFIEALFINQLMPIYEERFQSKFPGLLNEG